MRCTELVCSCYLDAVSVVKGWWGLTKFWGGFGGECGWVCSWKISEGFENTGICSVLLWAARKHTLVQWKFYVAVELKMPRREHVPELWCESFSAEKYLCFDCCQTENTQMRACTSYSVRQFSWREVSVFWTCFQRVVLFLSHRFTSGSELWFMNQTHNGSETDPLAGQMARTVYQIGVCVSFTLFPVSMGLVLEALS